MAITRKIYRKDETPVLTAQQLAELEALKNMSDDEIDLSDAPEQLDWSNAVRGRFTHKKVMLRNELDADVLAWLESGEQDFRTRLNEVLRQAMMKEKSL